MKHSLGLHPILALPLVACAPSPEAALGLHGLSLGTCALRAEGTTLTLAADCATSESLVVPEGFTLDGAGHRVVAVDPPGGRFRGGVVRNGGRVAHVTRLTVSTAGLAHACQRGNDRLSGISFDGADGSITRCEVTGVYKEGSDCAEGFGVYVRHLPPGYALHRDTRRVEIAHNRIDGYQKSGVVVNGDVEVDLHHNTIGAAVAQERVPAVSVQLGYAALGAVTHNHVDGNQWLGEASYAASAVLLFGAGGPLLRHNNLRGNADVGIHVYGGPPVGLAFPATVDNNRVFDEGEDGPHGDVGIVNEVAGSQITNNRVAGFQVPFDGVTGGKNKAVGRGARTRHVEELD